MLFHKLQKLLYYFVYSFERLINFKTLFRKNSFIIHIVRFTACWCILCRWINILYNNFISSFVNRWQFTTQSIIKHIIVSEHFVICLSWIILDLSGMYQNVVHGVTKPSDGHFSRRFVGVYRDGLRKL